jgi:hypothetical protein
MRPSRWISALVVRLTILICISLSCGGCGQVITVPVATATPLLITGTSAPIAPPAITLTTSPTPRPSLSPEEANRLMRGFLKDNGGCKLPCLWGITPG